MAPPFQFSFELGKKDVCPRVIQVKTLRQKCQTDYGETN